MGYCTDCGNWVNNESLCENCKDMNNVKPKRTRRRIHHAPLRDDE